MAKKRLACLSLCELLGLLATFGDPPTGRRLTGSGHQGKEEPSAPKNTDAHGRFTKKALSRMIAQAQLPTTTSAIIAKE
jgi:hypothetical protein